MKIVFANQPRVIAFGGMRITLTPGEPWDGDDPLVKANPDAFVDGPVTVRTTRNSSGFAVVPADPPADRPRGQQRRGKASGE